MRECAFKLLGTKEKEATLNIHGLAAICKLECTLVNLAYHSGKVAILPAWHIS